MPVLIAIYFFLEVFLAPFFAAVFLATIVYLRKTFARLSYLKFAKTVVFDGAARTSLKTDGDKQMTKILTLIRR